MRCLFLILFIAYKLGNRKPVHFPTSSDSDTVLSDNTI